MVLEGKLVEPWLTELQRAWKQTREEHREHTLTIDLENVTVIGEQAQNLLVEMMNQGAQFICCGVLTKHVVRQVARRCRPRAEVVTAEAQPNVE